MPPMVSREAALLNECITMMDQPFEEEDAFPAAPSSYAAEFAPLQRLRSISQEARPHFDPSIEDSLSPQDSLSAAGATPALGGQVLDAGPLQGTASVQPGLTHPQFVDASTPYPPARFDGHAPGLGRLNPEWRNGGGAEGYVQGHVPAGSSGVAVEKLGRRKSSSEADSAFGTWSTFEDHNGVDVWPHRVSRYAAPWPATTACIARGCRDFSSPPPADVTLLCAGEPCSTTRVLSPERACAGHARGGAQAAAGVPHLSRGPGARPAPATCRNTRAVFSGAAA